MTWIEVEPLHGPPTPLACPDGWESHIWTLTLEGDNGWFIKSDCNICTQGLEDSDWRMFAGATFTVRLATRTETFGGWGTGDPEETDFYIDLELADPKEQP